MASFWQSFFWFFSSCFSKKEEVATRWSKNSSGRRAVEASLTMALRRVMLEVMPKQQTKKHRKYLCRLEVTSVFILGDILWDMRPYGWIPQCECCILTMC
ncbi:unnamed protein product [Dibothriocephalus latus]|uniref:Uncharacterized protein n=1 Tax=Dibothriocephalus latus TaxID=60516 RepID=A0A3P7M7Y3_DIBLA|nr:unnamed protein product [Dibothriocephalus latus]